MGNLFKTWNLAITAAGMLILGCGGLDPNEGNNPPPPIRQLPSPALSLVAPTMISAGDDMTLFGSGFADKAIGQSRVTFDGTYQSTAGKINQVKIEVAPTFNNQGKMTWNFGPNIPFSPAGETGIFRGVIRVYNVGLDGKRKEGLQALGTEITVNPSILLKKMRPLQSGCAVGIRGTTDNTPFLFEVESVGLKAGTTTAPMRFIYTFLKQNFQFKGYFSNSLGMDPSSLFPATGPVSVIDEVTNGTISMLGNGSSRNVHVNKGNYTPGMANMALGADKLFGLTHLYTAPVPLGKADSYTATMNIVAIDSMGHTAKRSISMKVWAPIEVEEKTAPKPVQTFNPLPVSGCIPGGDIGRTVTYSELTSETRRRSFSFTSKLSGGFDIKVVRLNAEFGIEVSSEVSTTSAKSLNISGKILPKQFAVFYRQTMQLERRAILTAHGPCGSTQDLGEVVVTDWTWSPDLAKGHRCPPLPTSNLSPGQKF